MGGWACRRVGKARVYALEGGGGGRGKLGTDVPSLKPSLPQSLPEAICESGPHTSSFPSQAERAAGLRRTCWTRPARCVAP